MPNIPTFTDQEVQVRPGGAAQISPGAMGAPGEAAARGGAAVSDEMNAFLSRYVDARRAADAAHYTAQASETLGDLQHKWSLVPDRMQAQAGFDQDVAQSRKTLLDGISDPLVQSHVSQQFDSEVSTRRYDTANAAFRLESSARRGQLDTDLNGLANSAASATNPALAAKLSDNAYGAIKGAVAAGWMDPETGDKLSLNFRSQVQEVQARKLTNMAIDGQDGDMAHAVAAKLADPSEFPGLLPERREILQSRLEGLSYRLDQRAATQQAHVDAVADRSLRQSQARNEATLLAGINSGQVPSDSDIQHLANTGQITAGGVEALTAAGKSHENGIDDPQATLRLWHSIGGKTASSDMIFDAMNSRQISRNTAVTMMRSLDSSSSKQEDQSVRQSFAQLKTVLHGGAIEQGIIPDKSPQAALWAQAQGEWASRIGGGEAPTTVLPDMLKRYGHDTAAPTWLDQPKLGLVQSSQDLTGVISKTGQAFKAGKISQGDYTQQLQLLSKYKQFYGLQAQQRPQPKPAGVNP